MEDKQKHVCPLCSQELEDKYLSIGGHDDLKGSVMHPPIYRNYDMSLKFIPVGIDVSSIMDGHGEELYIFPKCPFLLMYINCKPENSDDTDFRVSLMTIDESITLGYVSPELAFGKTIDGVSYLNGVNYPLPAQSQMSIEVLNKRERPGNTWKLEMCIIGFELTQKLGVFHR